MVGQSTETSAGLAGLRIDANSGEPVYRQIAEGIRDAARAGKLAAGTRLPPTRDLARQLGVNRNTVVAAYDLLAAEGVLHSHTGRGTFVAAQNGSAPAVLAGAPDTWSLGFSQALERPGVGNLLSVYNVGTSHEGISFAGSYPAADLMPVDAFRKAFADELRERGAEVLSYGPSAGWGPLREAIAAEMRRAGSRVGSGEILVTSGSQQGLELIFRALLDPGDPIVIEDPTYTDPSKGNPEMFALCDVLCPHTPMMVSEGKPFRDFYLRQKEAGKTLWLYSCNGPARLLDPVIYHRAQAWLAFQIGAEGSFYWAFGCGGGIGDSWRAYAQAHREYSPYFVGPDSVMEGKHSEAVREGVQDYEYLRMLREKAGKVRASGGDAAWVKSAEGLLTDGVAEAVEAVTSSNMLWKVEKNRSAMDAVRVRVLDALEAGAK